MRVCWNRQTGTFEGRVSLTYGFKSRHSHHGLSRFDDVNSLDFSSFLNICVVDWLNSLCIAFVFVWGSKKNADLGKRSKMGASSEKSNNHS